MKEKYNRLFPPILSANSFLTLFSLFLLNKHGCLYGKAILEIIIENSNIKESVWKPSHGALYPILRDLEDAGLIYGFWEGNDGKKRTKYLYSITDNGRVKLQELLEEQYVNFVDSILFLSNAVRNLYDLDILSDVEMPVTFDDYIKLLEKRVNLKR